MKHYRAELVFGVSREAAREDDYPERHIPRSVVLVDEDDNRVELFGVRQASMSWGLHDVRVLKLEIIVRGIDEVYAGEQIVEGDASENAVFLGHTEAEVELPPIELAPNAEDKT